MENDHKSQTILLTGPERTVEIRRHPVMGFIFLKALMISFFRPNTIAKGAIVKKTTVFLKNHIPEKKRIANYKSICGFSENRPDIIPISYLQTLFIGLLGKFITSAFFPINPLGLVHIFQSFEQKRPVKTDERLDLSCTLKSVTKTQKGIETEFSLEVTAENQVVWQGISTFLTRSHEKKRKTSQKQKTDFLGKNETLFVPSDTGRKYAAVSGDFNPHHLSMLSARVFGFKTAIAHGMWSLARVAASIEKIVENHDCALIEAAFKLPVFMPATLALGYKTSKYTNKNLCTVDFELYDEQKKLPHLKGRALFEKQFKTA